MTKYIKNQVGGDFSGINTHIGDIIGDSNQIIQITLTDGKEVRDTLGNLVERLTNADKAHIVTLKQQIQNKEGTIKDKNQINQLLDAQLLQLKTQLHQKEKALEASEQRLATIFLENNGKDFSGSTELYAKALEALTNGDQEGALKLLNRHQLLEQKQLLDQEKEQQANAWLLRAQLLKEEDNWGEELDECYDMLVEIFPSWENCLEAGNHFQFINSFDKAIDYYQNGLQQANTLSKRATILNSLSTLFYDNNKVQDALKTILEAFQIRKKLALQNPQLFLSKKADTLNDLANQYADAGELNKALDTYLEIIFIYEKTEVTSLKFLPEIARTSNNIGIVYFDLEMFEKSKHYYYKSLKIREKLALKNPTEFEPLLANTLSNLANLQAKKGKYNMAINTFSRALEIRKKFAAKNPRAFLPKIARNLHNLAELYANNNKLNQALNAYLETLAIKTRLALQNPQQFEHSIASTLNSLANLYIKQNKINKAFDNFSKALKIRKKLTHIAPQKFELSLAETYLDLSMFYKENINDVEQSKVHATKALHLYQKYKEQVPLAQKGVTQATSIIES